MICVENHKNLYFTQHSICTTIKSIETKIIYGNKSNKKKIDLKQLKNYSVSGYN